MQVRGESKQLLLVPRNTAGLEASRNAQPPLANRSKHAQRCADVQTPSRLPCTQLLQRCALPTSSGSIFTSDGS